MFFKKFVVCALIWGFLTDVLAYYDYRDIDNEDLDNAEASGHGESPTTEKLKVQISPFRENQPTIRLISLPNSEGYFKEGTEFKAECTAYDGEPMWNFSKLQDQIKINASGSSFKVKEIQFQLTPEHNKMVLMCSRLDFPYLMVQFIIYVESMQGGIQKQNVIEDFLQTNSSSKPPNCDSEAGSIVGMQVAIGVLVLTVLVLGVLLFVVSRATGRLSIGGSKPSETNDNE